jgi:lipopolysaccharide export LptBFGC system permease protein LptF
VRILSRHLLASYAKLFVAILFGALIALSIIEMLVNFDRIVERESGVRGVATYLLLRIPSYYLPDVIPPASFVSAFLAIGLRARRGEVTAMKAAGVSPLRTALPILAGASVLSAGALVADETLVLACTRAWHRSASDADGELPEGPGWHRRGDTVYHVGATDPETPSLRDVTVFRLSPAGRLIESVRAEVVHVVQPDRWQLIGAVRRRFDPDRPDAPPITHRAGDTTLDIAAASDPARAEATAGTLSLGELGRHIDARSSRGRDATPQRALLHARLARPLAVLPLTLLAIPLGLAVERSRSLEIGALHGLAVIGAFTGIRTIALVLASGGWVGAVFGPWIALALLAGYGGWRLVRVPR